ncbi:hypothetical protein GGH13_003395 [Coemansia sp. S155-1]|nr:hypothetical protein GGH13_003395 [Coemansia sp. S155-1]
MGDKKDKDKGNEPMVGFVIFLMSLINILSLACYGLMVAYTTVYLTGIRTVVLGFVQFSMAFISLILAVLAAPMSQIYHEHFPVLYDPPDRAITLGLWQCALGAFLVGDPLFMELRDPKIMSKRSSWAQSLGPLTFATSIALGVGFLLGIYGFIQFSNNPRDEKEKEAGGASTGDSGVSNVV